MDEQMVVPPSFIKTKLTELFNSQFSKVVSDTIDSEIKQFQTNFGEVDEAKDKFYASLSEAKHTDYPEPIDYNGVFKFCGVCLKCSKRTEGNNMKKYDTLFNKYLTKGVQVEYDSTGKKNTNQHDLLEGEYGLMCSAEEERINNECNSGSMITNYGNLIYFHWNHIKTTCNLPDSDYRFPNFKYDTSMKLSNEYCEILGSMNLLINRNTWNTPPSACYDVQTICRITDIYKKYHPKASEICKIEMKQKEIKKSIIELQTLETEQVTRNEELDKRDKMLLEQEIKLKKDQQVHKDKLKNLFQREKSVQMKETIHGCKEELKDIALQLNDMYVLTDNPDESIQSKLNDILGKLNTLYAEQVPSVVMAQAI